MIENELDKLIDRNSVFIMTRDRNLSYGEFYENISYIANEKFNDISQGTKVALLVEDKLDFIINFFALLSIGATVIPLDTKSPLEIIISRMNWINCKNLVLDNTQLNAALYSEYNCIEASSLKNYLADGIKAYKYQCISPLSNIIVFTSGSSGTPKAVFHNIGNFIYSALGSAKNISLVAEDNWLLSLPLNHVGGLSILFRVFIAGASLSVAETPGNPQNDIANFSPTHISLVPTQLYRLSLSHANLNLLKELKAILIGGAGVWSELISIAKQHDLKIFTSYGSTEMCSQITTTCSFDEDELLTSGKPLENNSIKISSDGEILVKGKSLFQGYAEGDKVLPKVDEEGYFHSGDRGTIDEFGRLSVIGRIDNMFVSGGENIFPEEIEAALKKIKYIQSSVVVPMNDKEFGAIAVAFIDTMNNEIPDKTVINNELSKYLPNYKLPKYYLTFPTNYKPLGIKPNRAFLKKYMND